MVHPVYPELKIFLQQVSELWKVNLDNQSNNEELEQYGRRLYLCIDGIPLKNSEKSEDVLDSVKDLFELAEVNIPYLVVDYAHRIDCIYKDEASSKNCKGVMVRSTTFRHRRMLCRTRSRLKGVEVRLDLTKFLYDLLSNANNYVKEISTIWFYYVHFNCRFKVEFTVEDRDDVFFSSIDKLRDMTDKEI